jgi:hypothetical protein
MAVAIAVNPIWSAAANHQMKNKSRFSEWINQLWVLNLVREVI